MKAMKKIIASLLAVATVVAGLNVGTVKVDAASKTKTITTTQECSIWTRPNTTEKYRQKKVPAGHQITVYTDVIKSEKNDGKTFYKTKKGAYILCRCCDGNETTTSTSSAAAASFSDPIWARIIKEMQKANHVAAEVATETTWNTTYSAASNNVWGMAQVWMDSIGMTSVLGNAKFVAEWDQKGDLWGNGVYVEDYSYVADGNNGIKLYVYSGDKGRGITVIDNNTETYYYFEFWKSAE